MREELEELIKKFENRIKIANEMETTPYFDGVVQISEFAVIELKLILANYSKL